MWDLLPNGPIIERTSPTWQRSACRSGPMRNRALPTPAGSTWEFRNWVLATKLSPLTPETSVGGSTDVADVSWNTPTGVFVMPTLPLGVGLHTWPVTACGGMSIGLKGALTAAAVMTATGYDLLTDRSCAQRPRRFAKREGVISTFPLFRRNSMILPIRPGC